MGEKTFPGVIETSAILPKEFYLDSSSGPKIFFRTLF
jgi:hypothetical protein